MRLLFLALAGLLSVASAADQAPAPPKGVVTLTHTGWEGALMLSAPSAVVKAVVVPAIGGRIVHYSLAGENILWENPGGFGKTLANTTEGFYVGGYQCDLGPELRRPVIPSHRALWMGVHQGAAHKNYSVKTISEPDTALGIQMEKEIVMDADTGELGITQRMRNTSTHETAYCLWDRTLCHGGGYAFFPLNKKSRFPAGWSLRDKFQDQLFYDGDKPKCPQVRILDRVLVAKCEGEPTKLGADSDAGWIAYARGRLLFVKYFPYFPKGEYTDGGNSVELYFDHRAELEPLSPEIKLKPGESYEFPELWVLLQLDTEVKSHEQARALVKLIPPSPFKR